MAVPRSNHDHAVSTRQVTTATATTPSIGPGVEGAGVAGQAPHQAEQGDAAGHGRDAVGRGRPRAVVGSHELGIGEGLGLDS